MNLRKYSICSTIRTSSNSPNNLLRARPQCRAYTSYNNFLFPSTYTFFTSNPSSSTVYTDQSFMNRSKFSTTSSNNFLLARPQFLLISNPFSSTTYTHHSYMNLRMYSTCGSNRSSSISSSYFLLD